MNNPKYHNQNPTRNTYKNTPKEEEKPKSFDQRGFGENFYQTFLDTVIAFGAIGATVAAFVGVVELADLYRSQDPVVIGGPKNHELVDYFISTDGRVSEIKLDSTQTQIKVHPETGARTYTGPMKYELLSSRSPVSPNVDQKLVEDMRKDTRYGSITLMPKSSLEDQLNN